MKNTCFIERNAGSLREPYDYFPVALIIEFCFYRFIELCEKLLSDNPLFFLINSYTTGLAPAVLTYMISTTVCKNHGGHVESAEIGLPVKDTGLVLPCGASGRWEK